LAAVFCYCNTKYTHKQKIRSNAIQPNMKWGVFILKFLFETKIQK